MPERSRDGNGKAALPLSELQKQFARHIRDPEHAPAPPGIEDRRLAIYRRLFFNNIDSLLASNFPVIRSLCDDSEWRLLVREFYVEHRCQTPLFPEVAKEFLRYLQETRGTRPGDPPFLLELAHYEWVELAVGIDERELDEVPADPEGDLLQGEPVLSPLAWALSYRFPVHQIRPDFQPSDPPPQETHLLVYRNRRDEVRFMLLNDVSRLLLKALEENRDESGSELLAAVAQAIGHPEPSRVQEAGARLLRDFRSRDILLGTRPR